MSRIEQVTIKSDLHAITRRGKPQPKMRFHDTLELQAWADRHHLPGIDTRTWIEHCSRFSSTAAAVWTLKVAGRCVYVGVDADGLAAAEARIRELAKSPLTQIDFAWALVDPRDRTTWQKVISDFWVDVDHDFVFGLNRGQVVNYLVALANTTKLWEQAP